MPPPSGWPGITTMGVVGSSGGSGGAGEADGDRESEGDAEGVVEVEGVDDAEADGDALGRGDADAVGAVGVADGDRGLGDGDGTFPPSMWGQPRLQIRRPLRVQFKPSWAPGIGGMMSPHFVPWGKFGFQIGPV